MPLSGIQVIEMGQLLAGPFCGTLLGYFGAEVIKIEPPEGDPMRQWRTLDEGTSLWWRSLARNKKSVTLNLKEQKGRDLLLKLIEGADVLIENFRPGMMEKWGLGPDKLKALNPNLIFTRISGYGQTGPMANKPGFASVTEGFSGFRHLNGFPGQAPVRPNLSLGDSLAGLQAALGTCMALIERFRNKDAATATGQIIDIALFEAFFNLMESVVPEYDVAGEVRGPSGTTVTGIVPTNTYQCKHNKYIIIGGNGDSIYQRLMHAINRPDLANDPELVKNPGRVKQQNLIDTAINNWTQQKTLAEALMVLEQASVPAGPIYDIQDIFNDPQYKARGLIEEVTVNGKRIKIPSIVPKLSRTPGKTRWAGPELGEHNQAIWGEKLGLSEEELEKLKSNNVI